jgi:A118 family predicted phage portal protein
MPLPSGYNEPWPPKNLEAVNAKIASWSAWYSGDPDMLSAVYGGAVANDTTGFFASERGGWRAAVGRTLQRWFWGTRPLAGGTEQRTKLHVPIAGDIASASADLLFSEPPTLTVENAETQKRIDELVDDGVHASLLEGAEIAAALGGVYLRIVWDTNTSDRPWISAVHPDAAVPEWQWGRLSAVTFWRILDSGDSRDVIRHLERHEPGLISHAVYRGDDETLGTPVGLKDFPETKGITQAKIDTKTKRLTAVYVPNMRPNRIWRNQPQAAYLGRSDYSGTEQIMDALDETYSSLMRDVELGKARLVVPATYLMSFGTGDGAGFDGERKLYEGVGGVMGNADSGMTIEQVQFNIRIAEHQATATELLTRIVSGAGYSAQTFGLTDTVAVTATEVAAKERRSFITRDRKICYWRPALAEIVQTLLEIDAALFESGVKPELPSVQFGDTVSQDPLSQAQTLQALEAARAVSTETKVRMLHPDWDDDMIAEEVDLIDSANALADPTATFGPPGMGDNPGDKPPGKDAAVNGKAKAGSYSG